MVRPVRFAPIVAFVLVVACADDGAAVGETDPASSSSGPVLTTAADPTVMVTARRQ